MEKYLIFRDFILICFNHHQISRGWSRAEIKERFSKTKEVKIEEETPWSTNSSSPATLQVLIPLLGQRYLRFSGNISLFHTRPADPSVVIFTYFLFKSKTGSSDSGSPSSGTTTRKCRALYGFGQKEKWCKPCRSKKRCIHFECLPRYEWYFIRQILDRNIQQHSGLISNYKLKRRKTLKNNVKIGHYKTNNFVV